MTTSVLFVCIGNTCRSPMAEFLAKRARPDLNLESAGLCARNGEIAAQFAIDAMARLKIDMAEHRTRSVGSVDLSKFSLFVAMEYPIARELMKKFSIGEVNVVSLTVKDPYGDELIDYVKCRQQIETQLPKVWRRLG